MEKERKRDLNIESILPSAHKLTRIENCQKKGLTSGFNLFLGDALSKIRLRIHLPPVAEITVNRLSVGDELKLERRNDIFEGKSKIYAGQVEIKVFRHHNSMLEFVVQDNQVLKEQE